MHDKSERAIKPVFNYNPAVVAQVMETIKNYSFLEMEQVILLLHDSNLKSIGIGNSGISTGALMKELSYKIMNSGAKKDLITGTPVYYFYTLLVAVLFLIFQHFFRNYFFHWFFSGHFCLCRMKQIAPVVFFGLE